MVTNPIIRTDGLSVDTMRAIRDAMAGRCAKERLKIQYWKFRNDNAKAKGSGPCLAEDAINEMKEHYKHLLKEFARLNHRVMLADRRDRK